MSLHQAFRRSAVPAQVAQQLQAKTFPAPTRGLILNENESFMQPGGALVCDNWKPTLRGAAIRGGSIRWCDLHALDYPAWVNAHLYNTIGAVIYDPVDYTFWNLAVSHTSAATGLFSDERLAHPTYWTPNTTSVTRLPVISAFAYSSGAIRKMFAANASKVFEVTNASPALVKSGQADGNYSASQLVNASNVDFLIALNDAGDYPLRFNGTSWVTLNGTPPASWVNNTAYVIGNRALDTTDRSYWKCAVAHTSAAAGTFAADRAAHPTFWVQDTASDGASWIYGPAGSNVVNGQNLVQVCKYRNRWFFIESNSMNAWYLPLYAVGGQLSLIPLSGAATKGGKLLFCATWSIDAGDGIDDKLVFCTDLGELLVFTGSDPSSAASWKQEGRYEVGQPMGKNAWHPLGGDLLIATVDGLTPTSASITKTSEQLELAMISVTIRQMWRDQAIAKRSWAWTMERWDEYGGMFVTWPGGTPGNQLCAAINLATGAWARFTGWDATCFVLMRGDMFFGTQSGWMMQADRTGYDDGQPYVCTLVGGWETFGSPAAEVVWRQARASFSANYGDPFQPQLSSTTDYLVVVPTPPPVGPDPGVPSVWDQGLWDVAKWDQPSTTRPPVRNTGWVSIGMTGFAHAPIVQVTIGQQAKPNVELISITATYEMMGVNV